MKTLFRIGIILAAALLVSGITYLVVENTDLISSAADEHSFEGGAEMSSGGSGQERPEMSGADESGNFEHREGDGQHGASIERGLSSVFNSFLKISAIALLVGALQFLFRFVLKRFRPASAAA